MSTPLLRQASLDDYDQIADLEAASGLTRRPRDLWLHLWLNNPAYQALPDWPIGWVLECQGKIVGTIGNIPFFYHLGGRRYIASTSRAWAVAPQYRVFALQLKMQYMRQPHVDLCLNNTLNEKSVAVLKRLGWAPVPAGRWDQSAFWITSYIGCAGAMLPDPLSRMATRMADLRLPAEGISRVFRGAKFRTRHVLDWCSGFDERFDSFWERLKRDKPDWLLAARGRDFVEWHFKHTREQGRLWILAACEGPDVIGYAIFDRRNTKRAALKRIRLIDMVTLNGHRELCAHMIAAAVERCRAERIHVLDNVGCWIERDAFLNAKAPYHRKLAGPCYFYQAPNRELSRALQNPGCWHPTYYDGDASL